MNRLLEDKVAIVTGATGGIGSAIVSAFAADGARILVVSRSEERCARTVDEIRAQGGVAAACLADVTEPGAPSRIVHAAVANLGKVDILVNGAGVFVWKKLLELTPEDWNRTIETNLEGPFFLIQEAAKAMIEGGRGGSIINITSIHGLVGDPHVAAHCASKFGLTGLTRAAAEALREFDIRVNAIAPGSVERGSGDRRAESPMKKVTEADVASLACYLASDLSRAITGATIEAYGSTRTIIKA
ncbi:MAG TPA: SDR family NAD(P)-dependent oxidoreductase [Planctomycetota bacterium]|jgi:NAD(P)-dependent dehydrogenase (short-subunit alcohol dehydrogenase family)|nr:SDR family NAD(P)-dependent oxidoreductase [Planctomycetota bacterium]